MWLILFILSLPLLLTTVPVVCVALFSLIFGLRVNPILFIIMVFQNTYRQTVTDDLGFRIRVNPSTSGMVKLTLTSP